MTHKVVLEKKRWSSGHPLYQQRVYKWKNHFFEMKGDVGMSSHEKEREQEDAFTQTQTHS